MKRLLPLLVLLITVNSYAVDHHHGIGIETGLTGNNTEIFGVQIPNYIAIPVSINYMLTLDNYFLETGFGMQAGIKSIGKGLSIEFGRICATWNFSFGYLFRKGTKSIDELYHGVSGDLYLSFLDKANDIGFGASYLVGKNRWMLSLSTGANQNLVTKKWGSYGRIGLGFWLI